MNESSGLLSNIFDKRVLNKYTKLLPEKHNIYYQAISTDTISGIII